MSGVTVSAPIQPCVRRIGLLLNGISDHAFFDPVVPGFGRDTESIRGS